MMITEFEVKDILNNILIAKVAKILPHENADRLQIVHIELDENQKKVLPEDIFNENGTVQIVTAANNFEEGDFVPYLPTGHLVPSPLFKDGTEFRLESRPMRGEISHGMILAEDEIGIGDDHSGISIISKSNKYSFGVEAADVTFFEILTKDAKAFLFKQFDIITLTPELEEKINLIKSVGNPDTGGEIVGEDELLKVLTSGEKLYTYDGFEPSGQMHVAQGIIRAINTNKMIKAGFTFRMYVADWFGYLNNKMGGDIEKIRDVGAYFIEIWRASGMDLENTEFIWNSEVAKDHEYWELVMRVAKNTSLKRILKTTEIMGRNENDDLAASQILYPAMQTADIFHVIKAQVTELGMDQRKVNMLAREIGEDLGYWKPIVVSHGMLQGLQTPPKKQNKVIILDEENPYTLTTKDGGYIIEVSSKANKTLTLQIARDGKTEKTAALRKNETTTLFGMEITLFDVEKQVIQVDYYEDLQEARNAMKMSKSKPDTAIFMTDSRKDIERKIRKAYCPEGVAENNPILDYCKQIIFEAHHLVREEELLKDGVFEVRRPEKYGGDVSYKSYADLEKAFVSEELYPLDLKNAVVEYLDDLLKPVREHFKNDKEARKLLKKVQSYQVTR